MFLLNLPRIFFSSFFRHSYSSSVLFVAVILVFYSLSGVFFYVQLELCSVFSDFFKRRFQILRSSLLFFLFFLVVVFCFFFSLSRFLSNFRICFISSRIKKGFWSRAYLGLFFRGRQTSFHFFRLWRCSLLDTILALFFFRFV